MLGSSYNKFTGTLNGNDKVIKNVEINGSRVDYLGMIGYVNSGTIYGLVLNNIKVSGCDKTRVIGQTGGTNTSKANIYGIRMVNEVDSEGNAKGYISGGTYVGGLVGYVHDYSQIREIELDNINVIGYNFVGGLFGYYNNESFITINNVLVKTGKVKATVTNAGLVNGGYPEYYTNTIVENVSISSTYSIYTTSKSKQTYHSNNVTINGSKVSDGFSASLIGNLQYYANTLETLYTGDSNKTGYFFDYKDDGIHLVKAYEVTFGSPD